MGHRRRQVVEDVVLVGQAVEAPHRLEDPQVLHPDPLEQHGDPPALEVLDDVAEGVGGGGVEPLDIGQSQDDDPHARHGGELLEEALGDGEEERAVDAVDEDVLGQEVVLVPARPGVGRPGARR